MIRGKHSEDGWLSAYWGRERRNEPKDLMYDSPCSPDGHLLHHAFSYVEVSPGKTFVQELEDRGYDITTLQFSVKRKWKPNEKPVT